MNLQQNSIRKQNPQNGWVYFLRNKQSIDQNLDRYEAEMEGKNLRIQCDVFKQYSDQFMRCLDELIQSPQENIIHYQDFFIDDETKYLYVIQEYVERESFLNYQLMYNKLDDVQKHKICEDVAKGIYYLHLFSHRHRNINPENICFVNGQYKITNLNQVVHFIMKEKLDVVGDSCYWNQALILDQPYDHTIDIFAFACVVFEVFTSQQLFARNQRDRTSIPKEKMQELQKLPKKLSQFIIQVIVEGKPELESFIDQFQKEDLKSKKSQASSIGIQQFQSKFAQNAIKPPLGNDKKEVQQFQTVPTFQTIQPLKRTIQNTIPPPQQQFNQPLKFQIQGKIQDSSSAPIPSPSPQQQPFQFQQIQKTQYSSIPVFQQQASSDKQQQGIQKPFAIGQNIDQKPKFVNFTNTNNEFTSNTMNFNQVNFQLQSQTFNQNVPPQIFDTAQTQHKKNNSLTNHNFQEANQFKKTDQDEDIFKCQTDTSKEEREKENQKQIKIINDIQKVVREEQQEILVREFFELSKQNPNLRIDQIFGEIINKRVRNNLGFLSY